jgi:hypothetical protein
MYRNLQHFVSQLVKKHLFLSEENLLSLKPLLQIQTYGILVTHGSDITLRERNFEGSHSLFLCQQVGKWPRFFKQS